MAKWNDAVITTAGMALSATTLAGKKIKYTHVQTTDADLSQMTEDEIKAMTAFDNVVQDLNVGTVSVQDDHTVNIPVQITNQDIDKDYNLYGMALYAEPADGGDEIIYSVIVATVPDLIPAKGGSTVTGTDFNFKTHVSDASKVDITVIQTAGVTNEQLTNVLKDYPKTTEISSNYSKDTDVVHKAGVETITGAKTFAVDPVNAKNQPYITAAEVPATDLSNYLDKGTAGKTYETQADAAIAHERLSAPNLIDTATDDWQTLTNVWNGGWLPFNVVSGQRYSVSANIDSQTANNDQAFVTVMNSNPSETGSTKVTTGAYVIQGTVGTSEVSFTATVTGTYWIGISLKTNTGSVRYRYLVATQSINFIDYPTAQANRHGWNGVDKEQDSIAGRNYVLGTLAPVTVTAPSADKTGVILGIWTLSPELKKLPVDTPMTASFDMTVTNADSGVTYLELTDPWTVFDAARSYSNGTTHIVVPLTKQAKAILTSAGQVEMTIDHSTATYKVENFRINVGGFEREWAPAFEDKVTDNHDGTVTINGKTIFPFNKTATQLGNQSNLDGVTGTGFYSLNNVSGITHTPNYGATASTKVMWTGLLVYQNVPGGVVYQMLFGTGDGVDANTSYWRVASDSTLTWGTWQQSTSKSYVDSNFLPRDPNTGKATQSIDFSGTNKLTVNGGMPFVFDPNGVSADEATAKSASANDDFIHFTYDD